MPLPSENHNIKKFEIFWYKVDGPPKTALWKRLADVPFDSAMSYQFAPKPGQYFFAIRCGNDFSFGQWSDYIKMVSGIQNYSDLRHRC